MSKGKLRYYYGTMSSLKTGTLLTKVHQFEQSGCNTILLKPSFDTRDDGIIKSRAICEGRPCVTFDKDANVFEIVKSLIVKNVKTVVFVDEVNFITPEQVKQLWQVTRKLGSVDVFTYGLKTNYLNELFESSKQLLIMADTVEEIKSMCSYCHNKATTHLRYVNDKPTFVGEVCIVGDVTGTEYYKSVCQDCWHKEFEKGE